MQCSRLAAVAAAVVLGACLVSFGEVKVVVDHNAPDQATPQFKFKTVPAPAKQNGASNARFTIVDGERDETFDKPVEWIDPGAGYTLGPLPGGVT